jgi:NADPH-dependent curcumin reductase CurA
LLEWAVTYRRISGNIVFELPMLYEDMGQWIAEGKLRWEDTVFEGLENAPKAFIGLFDGRNLGKMLVKIGSEAIT